VSGIAQLPMYDFPEVRDATDALWRAIAERLRDSGLRGVPDGLEREVTREEAWRNPGLLLGQSCGYPAMSAFSRHLRIVATPIYVTPGCRGASHCSFILVTRNAPARRLADLRGARFALNSRDSNSGMNLPRLAIALIAGGGGFFSEVIETGSHAASVAALAAGDADTAAIDCVSYALLLRHRSEIVAQTQILARTASSPALPFVTARSNDETTVVRLRDAVAGALSDPSLAAIRKALFLGGMVPADAADYSIVLDYEARARQLGYPELA
jgi:ABC-type phosphate/phosphonate transport system substrate-binding protein